MVFDFLKNKSSNYVKGNGKVVSLLNQKGGVGKTTMAFNLAHALASAGHRVLCIDMDPQGNLGLLFGVEDEENHILQLLLNSVRELKALHTPIALDEVLKETSSPKIDFLPAGQDLSGFELSVAGISGPRQLIFKKFLEKNQLDSRYDYIIVDGPPTLGLLVVNILCACDGVLVPFQPDQFSRKGLEHFHEIIEDIEDMGITQTPKVLGYIPNLVEARRKQVGSDFEKIKNELGEDLVFDPFANRVQLVKSSAAKKSVFDFHASEYKELQAQFSKMVESIENQLQ